MNTEWNIEVNLIPEGNTIRVELQLDDTDATYTVEEVTGGYTNNDKIVIIVKKPRYSRRIQKLEPANE
jgi:uncharacterized membrane-anchored protein YitT (DUF2179 family)